MLKRVCITKNLEIVLNSYFFNLVVYTEHPDKYCSKQVAGNYATRSTPLIEVKEKCWNDVNCPAIYKDSYGDYLKCRSDSKTLKSSKVGEMLYIKGMTKNFNG